MSNLDIETLLSVNNEEVLQEMGYRLDEKELSIRERDLDPTLPENRVVTSSRKLSSSLKFTKDLADLMTNRALDLGIITEPLAFPVAKYVKPDDIEAKQLNQEFPNPRLDRYHGRYLVSIEAGKPVYTKDGVFHNHIAALIHLDEDKTLWAHLQAGYCAYIYVNKLGVLWISIPHYYLSKKYFWSVHQYKEQVKAWEELKSNISHAQTVQKALKQHYELQQLPFSWSVGIKQVLRDLQSKGLANGVSRQTVVHLVIEEDYQNGRFVRNKGDYLCTPKTGKPNWTSSDYQHVVTVAGKTVIMINHEITCKTCLAKVDTILSTKND